MYSFIRQTFNDIFIILVLFFIGIFFFSVFLQNSKNGGLGVFVTSVCLFMPHFLYAVYIFNFYDMIDKTT